MIENTTQLCFDVYFPKYFQPIQGPYQRNSLFCRHVMWITYSGKQLHGKVVQLQIPSAHHQRPSGQKEALFAEHFDPIKVGLAIHL